LIGRHLSPAALAADHILFGYPGGKEVFSGLSLTARPGELLSLVGPSGCGKTTLLNLLSGFLRPSLGTVRINGVDVSPGLTALGYVFQTPHLFPWLSVLDNVRFGLRMAGGMSAEAQRRKARRYLSLVGLEHAQAMLPQELSGGMKQRVALARALVLEPGVLLMDEPFAALDAITRRDLQDELLRIQVELGQTIVFITHDLEEAIFLADRVLVLGLPPDGIRDEFAIDLPRPREGLGTRACARFAEYRGRLSSSIAALTDARRPAAPPAAGAYAHAAA